MKIRVLLVDDHLILRQGIRVLLEHTGDISVIGDTDTGTQALQLAAELHPDVIVADISLPDINGIEVTRRIKASCPEIAVLALSMHSDKRYISEILTSGASGFLLKDCAAEELAIAIRAVHSGQTYLSPSVAETIVNSYVRQRNQPRLETVQTRHRLTSRETEILQSFAEGQSTKEIAFNFGISIKTVETHRQHIMRKLHLYNIADLTRFAIREGIASLS